MPPTYFEGGEPVYMGVCPPSCHYEQGANHLLAHLGMCVKREQSATTVIPHHGFRHPDEIHREYIFICHPYDGFCTSDMTLCFSQSPPPPLSPPPSPVSPAPLAPPGAVSFPPSMPGAVDLIIDTDMSVDVDDAGMLCAAHALADLGEANILAVMHNSHLKAGAGAISAINSYYGRSSLPIGVYRGDVGKNSWFDQPDWTRHGRGVYVEDLVQTFSPPQPNWVGLPDAVDAYRSTLATARDGSVSIVQVGYATNMLNLLESPPDHHSALNGRDLVAKKAGRVFIMGGHDPGGSQLKQWSFAGGCKEAGCSYESLPSITKRQLELLPQSVPKIFFSFESGEKQQTGRNIAERNLPNSPCDRAYAKFCAELGERCQAGGRGSWDPQTLLYAVRGDRHSYYNLVHGFMTVGESGSNHWVDGNSTTLGNEWMLRFHSRYQSEMEQELEKLYFKLPLHVPPPPNPPSAAPRASTLAVPPLGVPPPPMIPRSLSPAAPRPYAHEVAPSALSGSESSIHGGSNMLIAASAVVLLSALAFVGWKRWTLPPRRQQFVELEGQAITGELTSRTSASRTRAGLAEIVPQAPPDASFAVGLAVD